MLEFFSFPKMAEQFCQNKDLIQKHLNGENYNYRNSKNDEKNANEIMGLSVGIFLVIFIISFVFFIWALVLLIKNWKILPTWAQVVGVLSILGVLGGPVVTIVVVYIGKASGRSKSSFF